MNDMVQNHPKIIVGVVSNEGLILNNNGNNPGYDVRVGKVTGRSEIFGTLDGSDEERPSDPIVIATPHWYTDNETRYPVDIAHLGLAVIRARFENMFTISAGTFAEGFNGELVSRNIGMNFLAIDPDLEDDNIKFVFS